MCNPHPLAPHGFNRNQSHTLHRYVCDCEGWDEDGMTPEDRRLQDLLDEQYDGDDIIGLRD